jgi:streptogramin lyase
MKRSFTLLLPAAVFVSACSKKSDISPPPIVPIQNTASVTTFAGSGAAAAIDGTKILAAFNSPTGIAINADGFLFIAEKQSNIVRIISPQGVVNTIAGTGTQGFSNTAGAVTFNFPSGVAVDANGNVYVADQGNSAIRAINTQAIVTTFAGGPAGFANGRGTAAAFNAPSDVAVDAAGNVFVADDGNHMIRKITPLGDVTTFAGDGNRGSADGPGATASFNGPEALCVDTAGNVYVADQGNNVIRKITKLGVVTTLAGSGNAGAANGKGTAASFNGPAGVAVDTKGNVYVGDSNNNLIRKITPDGTVSTFAGTGAAGATDGTPATATFKSPQGVVVDVYGRVFVVDTGNNLIRLVTP